MLQPQSVILVCYGNLCRSPMAHGLMRSLLPDSWPVSSAGTHAFGGSPPTRSAQSVARAQGIEIGEQRSEPLQPQALKNADHVFTMSIEQARFAARLAPSAAGRIRLFGAFAPAAQVSSGPSDPGGGSASALEVVDPMGGDPETYGACFERLRRCSEAAATWLLSGADADSAPPAIDQPAWPAAGVGPSPMTPTRL